MSVPLYNGVVSNLDVTTNSEFVILSVSDRFRVDFTCMESDL